MSDVIPAYNAILDHRLPGAAVEVFAVRVECEREPRFLELSTKGYYTSVGIWEGPGDGGGRTPAMKQLYEC